jgi:excisionase family DNA binding protein
VRSTVGLHSIQPSEDEADAIRALWIARRTARWELPELPASTEADGDWRLPKFELTMPNGEVFDVPPSLMHALWAALDTFVQGDAVAIVPADLTLTTTEAADVLGISRTYLVKLIDQGELPFQWVGSHRRLRVEDLLAYRKIRQSKQRSALTELIEESERIGLRYSDAEAGD